MQNGDAKSPIDKENYFHKYFQYASFIISSYKGKEPFHLFLKNYFSQNKKHGSKDRKLIATLCYNYFRLGCGVSEDINQSEKFLLSIFLCENKFSLLPEFFKPEWNASVLLPQNEKLALVPKEFKAEKIFPFPGELNEEIDFQKFSLSFLIQPKLFIRIRPGFKSIVHNKIKAANISFEEINDDCLAFSNNEKVSDILDVDKEAVVQDYNSQQTLNLIRPLAAIPDTEIKIWDCCAGSGGKSILAFDLFEKIYLTVTDKRKNILENLKSRFVNAGIKKYRLINVDLEKSSVGINESFDIIIADVPCTGSGTWARIPEQLHFFKQNEIEKYISLQRKIIENILPHLKNNGHLLYITCSVFKKENEENVTFFQEKFELDLLKKEYLRGYEMQADTLFAALFKKRE